MTAIYLVLKHMTSNPLQHGSNRLRVSIIKGEQMESKPECIATSRRQWKIGELELQEKLRLVKKTLMSSMVQIVSTDSAPCALGHVANTTSDAHTPPPADVE
ncbi:hypothetical protein ACLOJK_031709 [Asimina triloba]